LKALLDQADSSLLVKHGISPHAPYTVSPELYRRAAEFARLQGRILATHVAETRAELQFLQNGTGEFRDFLGALGTCGRLAASGLAPIPYLDSLGVLGEIAC